MKAVRKIILFIGIMIGFAACSSVDQPDAFIGSYTYSAEGDLDIYVGGMKVQTLPLDHQGTFTIEQEEGNRVIIVAKFMSFTDTLHAVVKGDDEIALETNSFEYSMGGVSLQMMMSQNKAKRKGNQLSGETDIMATGTFESYSVNGKGHIAIEATKKD